MTRNFYALLAALLLFCPAFAQTQPTELRGQVLDETGAPLPFATALLFSSLDSALTQAGYTDAAGNYNFSALAPGEYYLHLRFTGMASRKFPDFSLRAGEAKIFPPVQMQPAATELATVEIAARRPAISVRPDKTIFYVAGNPNATGANALELLRKSPGVLVDHQDNILLMGKGGVQIYINGKPSPLSGVDLAAFLESLSSTEIEAIEIIPNPSARWDAQGNAGIINIRLREDRAPGTNASANLGYNVGRYAHYLGGCNANYRNRHVNVFGSFSGKKQQNFDYMDLTRQQNGFGITQRLENVQELTNQRFRAGADFSLHERHSFGLQVSGNFTAEETRSASLSRIYEGESGATLHYLRADGRTVEDRRNLDFNLNYAYDDGEGRTWKVDLDHRQFDFVGEAWLPNVYYDSAFAAVTAVRNFRSYTPSTIATQAMKVDYERPALGGVLAVGLKLTRVNSDNALDWFRVEEQVEEVDPTRSNEFVYREAVSAGYLSFQRTLGRVELQAGLRAEHTYSRGELTAAVAGEGDEVFRRYLNLFPSAGIVWRAHENHAFGLNYSRRIDRPRYTQLNPFREQVDELTYREGNPFLQPQLTQNVSVTHTFLQHVTTALSYARTTDLITDFVDTTGAQAAFQTTINLGEQQVWGINLAVPFEIMSWWTTYTAGGASFTQNHSVLADGREVDLAQGTWNVYHQSSFELPHDLSVQISGWYTGPGIWGTNFRFAAMGSADAGVTWRFAEERGAIQVSVSDVFRTQQWEGRQEFSGLSFTASGGYQSRLLRTQLSYNF